MPRSASPSTNTFVITTFIFTTFAFPIFVSHAFAFLTSITTARESPQAPNHLRSTNRPISIVVIPKFLGSFDIFTRPRTISVRGTHSNIRDYIDRLDTLSLLSPISNLVIIFWAARPISTFCGMFSGKDISATRWLKKFDQEISGYKVCGSILPGIYYDSVDVSSQEKHPTGQRAALRLSTYSPRITQFERRQINSSYHAASTFILRQSKFQ